MTSSDKGRSRRGLLETTVRTSLLGVLGLLTAHLVDKTIRGPINPDETCGNRGVCRSCRALANCRSLQAELFRQRPEER